MSNFKPQKALFNTFSNGKGDGNMDKENYPQQQTYQQSTASFHEGFSSSNFSLEGLYGPKQPLKRTLMDAAPIHEARQAKKIKVDEDGGDLVVMQDLPTPDSFPALIDDGSKPAHSYAQLIGMSILRSENRRLTLAQIYKWISDTYSHYSATDAGWQNSIRHNLSLNKAFEKQERPKDDPGKGNYWLIKPGMEYQFIKEKGSKKAAALSDNAATSNGSTAISPSVQTPTPASRVSLPETSRAPFHPIVPAMPQTLPRQPLPSLPTYSLPPPPSSRAQEPSSDATIPDSDVSHQDAAQEKETDPAPPSSPLMQSSPPTALMHSSPPVPRHVQRRQDTPPPVPRFPTSSRSRSTHRRKFQSMDDSGYFSSLDSSAMRYNPRLLTSEADRPRIKRGRAEEEIARLRGSSYDSPTKSRILGSHQSSSPVRRPMPNKLPTYQMLPPLTPALKLKAPMRPPPSVSPNTNLRLHRDRVREMVGSPLRDMTCLDEENIPWSPEFNLDAAGTPFVFHDNIQEYDIFKDPDMIHVGALENPFSPEKKNTKRPHLNRSVSANILADITKKHGTFAEQLTRGITSTPRLNFTPGTQHGSLFSPARLSPAKSLSNFFNSPNPNLASPTKGTSSSAFTALGADFDFNDDFLGAEFLEDDVGFPGLDIMQGFQKIGAGAGNGHGHGRVLGSNTSPKAGSSRPNISRSFSTRF